MPNSPGTPVTPGTLVTIDEALTRRVADLARLELTEQEVKTFTRQLESILGYVDLLQKVDVSQVEPLTQAMTEFSMREDEVVVFPPTADGKPRVLTAAGGGDMVLNDGYKVPQII